MTGSQDAMRSVELVYRPEVRDVSQALRARGRLTLRSRLPGIVLPWALLVFLVSSSYFVLDDPAFHRMLGVLVVSSLLVSLMLFLLLRRAAIRSLYRFIEAQGECRTTVGDGGVRIATGSTEASYGWDLYPRYAETDDLFVMVSRDKGAVGFVVLPKRGVRHPGDVDRLRAILDRHITRGGRNGRR